MRTDELIEELSNDLVPARPGRPTHQRVALWFILSCPVIAVSVWFFGLRPDIAAKLLELRFVIEQLAALLTAATACAAALVLTTPGADRRIALVPAIPGTLWLTTLGIGCIADWLRARPATLTFYPEAECLLYIGAIGAIPAVILVAMLRRGAPLAPRAALFMAGLAAAGLANFGLRLFHTTDAGLMVLVWQFGSVLVLSLAASLAGPRFLRWPRSVRRSIEG